MTPGKWKLLSPRPDVCQVCARKHEDYLPHDRESFYYQTRFNIEHGRSPTWNDALAHCSPEVRKVWIEGLAKFGVIVEAA